MSAARAVAVALGWGFVLTLLSSLVAGEATATYADIMGCERGCRVAAAGWPFPYLIDYPGLSPAGSAALSGAALGADKLTWPAFLATLAVWSLASLVAARLIRRRRD